MTEPAQNPFDILLEKIRQIVREEVTMAIQNGAGCAPEKDVLLTPKQAATIIGVKVEWLYRHSKKLPFARRLSRKMLRFSEPGLRRWLAAKKS